MENILSREKLKERLESLKGEGEKVVFTNGCFDIIHAGHVRYLKEAKKLGDILVLALNSDSSVKAIKGERRPIVPQEERAIVVGSLESVDYVTLFDEETPLQLIEYLRPHILVKGGDWDEENVVGREAVRQWGGEVVVIPEVKGVSTTNIIEKIRNNFSLQKN
ncbi:MAG: D-glycero-beta-D-manno-heptose 1-phosphate adenylyltransferase [Thermodesulfobacteriota bacterium]|nr:D-glycero-beta-D-manno-heptose 1-phosphate adenylyltransferase [Thermodesulfobacteriota bacterium]